MVETEIMTQREAVAVADMYRRERDDARGAMAVFALLRGQELNEVGRIDAANFVRRSAARELMQQHPGIQNGLARLEPMN